MRKLFAVCAAAMMLAMPVCAQETDLTAETVEVTTEQIDAFIPAEINYEAELDALTGKWTAYKVGSEGTYEDITPEDRTFMEMEINGTTVTMNGFVFENEVFELEEQDGGLSAFFADEDHDFEVIAINCLEDDTVRFALVTSAEKGEMTEFFFVPAETETMTEAE